MYPPNVSPCTWIPMLIGVPYFVTSCCSLKTAAYACSGTIYILKFIILTREFFQTNKPNFISEMLWGFSGNLIHLWNTHDNQVFVAKDVCNVRIYIFKLDPKRGCVKS